MVINRIKEKRGYDEKIICIHAVHVLIISGCSSEDKGNSADKNKGEKVSIEVMMFEGGFGSEWVKESAQQYMDENENVEVKVSASPDIHQQLQTRFLSGEVPDLINPGPSFDIQGVIKEGMIRGFG